MWYGGGWQGGVNGQVSDGEGEGYVTRQSDTASAVCVSEVKCKMRSVGAKRANFATTATATAAGENAMQCAAMRCGTSRSLVVF